MLGPTEDAARSRAKTKVGTIISQSPPAKTPVAEGSTITVVVAVGSGLRTVPNVVGKGIAQASALIKGAGLAPVLNPLPLDREPDDGDDLAPGAVRAVAGRRPARR